MPRRRASRAPESVLLGQIDTARHIIRAAGARPPTESPRQRALTPDFERIRWFPLPGEVLARLRSAPGRAAA
jgi:hypothetical protein